MRSREEPTARGAAFRRRPRVPPWYWAVVAAGPVALVVLPVAAGEPANPGWWWQLLLLWLAAAVVVGVAVIPQAWSEVVVDERGLHLRGRLVVPADELGRIEVLSGGEAGVASWFRRWRGRRIPWRQNLYGGGFGWGPGVVLEEVPPRGEASLWLLPGPRARELAEALSAVRAHPPRRAAPGQP